jgi:hypothetical protein
MDNFIIKSDLLKLSCQNTSLKKLTRKGTGKKASAQVDTIKTTRAYKKLPTTIRDSKVYEDCRLAGFRSLAITSNQSPLGRVNNTSPTFNTSRTKDQAKVNRRKNNRHH